MIKVVVTWFKSLSNAYMTSYCGIKKTAGHYYSVVTVTKSFNFTLGSRALRAFIGMNGGY